MNANKSAAARLSDAAVYNVNRSNGARVLAGYIVINEGTGNAIKISPNGISVSGDAVVGIKPGLRLATEAEVSAMKKGA